MDRKQIVQEISGQLKILADCCKDLVATTPSSDGEGLQIAANLTAEIATLTRGMAHIREAVADYEKAQAAR